MNMKTNILVVEDEEDIAELLCFGLQRAGFSMIWESNLKAAQSSIKEKLPDVIILDWMLPDGDGIKWLQNLRSNERTSHLPIIMLTARAQDSDKLKGLENGADDYMTKPFSPQELIARINNILRRTAPQHLTQTIVFKDCSLNDEDHSLKNNSTQEILGNTEFKLLKYLLTHQNKTYSRAQLIDFVWGDHVYIEERTIDVHVLRLRKILKNFQLEDHLETVRSLGYRWKSEF